jgi:hypothetical protein
MSRQPINLAGIFHLERQAVRPLETRRSITSDTGVEPVVLKKSVPVPSLLIPAGQTQTNTISIATEMELHSLQVSLAFGTPLPHSSLFIKLRSPGTNPVELVLYDGQNLANAINSKLLESVTFPLDRPSSGDFDLFLRSVPQTLGQWKILVSNYGAQSVTLVSWTLRLEGQPVTDVVGVVKNGATPLAGVTVGLDSVPFSLYSSSSGADGQFTLARVPLLPLNFTAARPGYLPADAANPGLSSMFTRPFVGQQALFTPLETNLFNRFNPLAGAPVALAAVPGFSSGTTNSPFELQLLPEATGAPRIIAGPLVAFVGSTVDFYAVNPASTLLWRFGDGTNASAVVTNHAYQTPGYYHARLYSPSNRILPNATANVLILPAPGHAPSRPADLAGDPTALPTITSNAAYSAYLFQPFFTSAGVIPARKAGTDPTTGADRYVTDIAPQISFALGETNEFGAAYVPIMPIQHMYAASMDIDLAPYVSPENSSRRFDSDGFTNLDLAGLYGAINVNEQGFKDEDFNYSLVSSLWENTRIANCTNDCLEYSQDAEVGLIVWGNILEPPRNYATQTYQARDGASFAFALDDPTFHPHVGTTTLPDLETHNLVTHYRMACSLGATILTAPISSASVKPAKARRSQPDNPLDPELSAAPDAVSRNLYYQLHTGFLDFE